MQLRLSLNDVLDSGGNLIRGEKRMSPTKKSIWAKRIGAGAFLFFLLKGLAWLTGLTLVAAAATR